MYQAIRNAKLRFVYARYARAKGWNDHPIVVRQHVEMFAEFGTGPVAEALSLHDTSRHRWAARLARSLVAAVVVSIAAYAAYHASPAAAEVSPSTTRPTKAKNEPASKPGPFDARPRPQT